MFIVHVNPSLITHKPMMFRGGEGDRKQLSLEKLSEMERRMGLEGGRRH